MKASGKYRVTLTVFVCIASAVVFLLLNLVLPSPAGRLALISATCSVTLSGSQNLEEAVGSFEGKGVGSGNMNFLIDQGYFTQYRLDYSINGAMGVRRAGTKLLEWPVTISASAEWNHINGDAIRTSPGLKIHLAYGKHECRTRDAGGRQAIQLGRD